MELFIYQFQIIGSKSDHRIYALGNTGKIYFYEPRIKKWIPLESQETGTQEEYKKTLKYPKKE